MDRPVGESSLLCESKLGWSNNNNWRFQHRPSLARQSKYQTYLSLLEWFNLHQIVSKKTRITSTRRTLVDHIIVSHKDIVRDTDMLHCPMISDHDGPYALLNVRLKKYQPRFKYIRDERQFSTEIFLKDAEQTQFEMKNWVRLIPYF